MGWKTWVRLLAEGGTFFLFVTVFRSALGSTQSATKWVPCRSLGG